MLEIGPRVYIRDVKYTDEDDLFDLYKNKEVGDMAGWKYHKSISTTRNLILGYIYNGETFVVVNRLTEEVMGTISLYRKTFRFHVKAAELGFSLRPNFWGNGYMQEAIHLILNYAFNEKKYEIVSVAHRVDNLRSKNTIIKTGFVFEGIVRYYRKLYDGTLVDAAIYSLKYDEYERIENK